MRVAALGDEKGADGHVTGGVDEESVHVHGPRLPILVLVRVATDIQSKGEECRGNNKGKKPGSSGQKRLCRAMQRKLGQKGTKGDISTKSFWKDLAILV